MTGIPEYFDVEAVFSHRERPQVLITSRELSDNEREGIEEVGRFAWRDLPVDVMERHFDAFSLMAPAAFCYYLPAVVKLTVEHTMRNSIVAVSIMHRLDRTPDESLWDSHFLARWPLLSRAELAVIERWVLWLAGGDDFALDEISVIRALETLTLLKRRATA